MSGIGYSETIAFILGGFGGFLLGAGLFLGFGRARTSSDVEAGADQDRREGNRRRCTRVTARWCPLHGECTCRIDDGEDEYTEINMDSRSCPLHGSQSLHGAA